MRIVLFCALLLLACGCEGHANEEEGAVAVTVDCESGACG